MKEFFVEKSKKLNKIKKFPKNLIETPVTPFPDQFKEKPKII